MDLSGNALQWLAGLSLRWKLFLGLIVVVSVMEFGVKRWASDSIVYRGWSAVIRRLGEFWTAVILSIVYVVAVGPINLIFRIKGQDMLDRRLDEAPSAWRAHVPNPLGPTAAARHQF
jgi:hypothetical protein